MKYSAVNDLKGEVFKAMSKIKSDSFRLGMKLV